MGLDGMGWMGWVLCVGLLYEHRFAVLIMTRLTTEIAVINETGTFRDDG